MQETIGSSYDRPNAAVNFSLRNKLSLGLRMSLFS